MFPTQRFLFWIWLLPAALWGADTDVLTNRLIITSNQVNALSRSDVRSGSTAIQMYYDATDGVIYASKLNGWNQDWALYIQAPSALGASGPLGAYGPLGSAGPLFNVSATAPAGFVASQYTYGTYAWGSSERYGADAFGASGPLGASGPITEASLYNTMYHLNENASCVDGLDGVCDWNDFPHALDPSGVWGVLGPLGPTGALGALGPLGILGFGHQTGVVYVDGNGSYTGFYKNGALTRRLDIPYNGGSVVRRYDLFEMYSRAFLQSAQLSPATFTNDTSFSVDARSFSPLTSTNDEYVFASNYDQYISIVVTPVNPHSDFDFKVFRKPLDSSFATNPLGNFPATALITADSAQAAGGLIDFAVFRARPGEIFKVKITHSPYASSMYNYGYVIHVAGSGFQESTNSGATFQNSVLFAPRRNSVSTPGAKTFQVVGKHQSYKPF